MSFLTPLYLAGLLAISLPLVFHLIRRMPTGQVPFSSLMFLSPSPPRLTRKSRLDNLLLLLLRAAALLLLGAAFARPFLRATTQLGVADLRGRKVALLIDTSASMRRDALWRQALTRADAVLDDLGPADDVALIRFDSRTETLVPFDDVSPRDVAPKVTRIRKELRSISPSWRGSNLGQALVTVADDVNQIGDAADIATRTERQVVLISDLQEGCRIEPLRNYQWPDDVQLAVHTVAPATATNAGLHPAAALDDTDEAARREALRVRVTNGRRSTQEQFELRWQTDLGTTTGDGVLTTYVPAGETRVVRVPLPVDSSATNRLVLTGDEHVFDNTLYLTPLQQEDVLLVYIGSDPPNDPTGLRYYLERAFAETSQRKVHWSILPPDQPFSLDALKDARLVVVGAALPDDVTGVISRFLASGGSVLFVVLDEAYGPTLARLLGRENLQVTEADDDDYAMLGEIAFSDPLFSRFADPRYSDFTKIQFWKHRHIDVADVADLQVLARFDNGDPALVEQVQQRGRMIVLTSGWQPSDSQLARSTKFVPLLAGLLERSSKAAAVLAQYTVGDSVLLPAADGSLPDRSIRVPSGDRLEIASDASHFDATDAPGVYEFASGDVRQWFAVNVDSAESDTDPMSVDLLLEAGVQLGKRPTREQMATELRQMRDVELEQQQKVWRWLIAVAVGVLILETWLAGRLARKATQPAEVVQ